MFRGKFQLGLLTIERCNKHARGLAVRLIFEGPIVGFAVRVDVRPFRAAFSLGGVEAIGGREHKAFAARTAHGYTEEIGWKAELICAPAVQAVFGVKKTEQHVAIAHSASQSNF